MTEPTHREPKQRDHLGEALQEVALSLAGIVATYPVDDEIVVRLTRSIGAIADRHLSAGAGMSGSVASPRPNPRLRPHPAIVELLARLGRPARPAPETQADLDGEWLRLPGLFRRSELGGVIDVEDEYRFEKAGQDATGIALFAVYSRLYAGEEDAP